MSITRFSAPGRAVTVSHPNAHSSRILSRFLGILSLFGTFILGGPAAGPEPGCNHRCSASAAAVEVLAKFGGDLSSLFLMHPCLAVRISYTETVPFYITVDVIFPKRSEAPAADRPAIEQHPLKYDRNDKPAHSIDISRSGLYRQFQMSMLIQANNNIFYRPLYVI